MSVDSSVALVTLAQVRTWLKTSSGTTEDSLFEDLINRAGALANTFTGRKLKSASRVEYYDGDGTQTIMLQNTPVTAVASIYDDTNREFAADSLILSTDYSIDKPAGIVRLEFDAGVFTAGRRNIKVSYTAGYKDATDNLVPYDLQEAALLIVQHSYKRAYQDQRSGIQSETIGDKTVTYSNDPIPAKAKKILDQYRQIPSPSFSYAD